MAVTAKAIIEGATLSEQGGTITYHVTGLDASGQVAMAQALTAPGIQQLNESHPFIGGIKVVQPPTVVDVFPGEASVHCRVQVTYGTEDNGGGNTGSGGSEFSLSTTTVQEVTELDASGNPIIVRYAPGAPGGITGGTPQDGEEWPKQNARVSRYVVLRTLRIVRNERELPLHSQQRHAGNVNSKDFMFFPPEYWLMTNYTATSSDGGLSYNVTREFTGNRRGWLKTAAYVLPDGGIPAFRGARPKLTNDPQVLRLDVVGGLVGNNGAHPDQREFEGLTVVRVEGRSDFNDMNLPVPENVDAP